MAIVWVGLYFLQLMFIENLLCAGNANMSKMWIMQPCRGNGCITDNLNIVPWCSIEVFIRHRREHDRGVARNGFGEKCHFLAV